MGKWLDEGYGAVDIVSFSAMFPCPRRADGRISLISITTLFDLGLQCWEYETRARGTLARYPFCS